MSKDYSKFQKSTPISSASGVALPCFITTADLLNKCVPTGHSHCVKLSLTPACALLSL